MKWVWAALFLLAMAVGSLLVWRGFGIGEPSLRGARQGLWRATKQSLPRDRSLGGPVLETIASSSPSGAPRNDRGTVLAVFGEAPDFALTERSGGTFSRKDLAGKPWIADFIFTSCAGQCPLMSLQMKKFQSQLPPETDFRFVSFTVDPDRDTPEVLAEYGERYGAEKERWFFLTGAKEEMNRILKEFFLSPVDQPAMHSIRFILVDGEGKIRGYYDSSDAGSMDQLMHDAKILVNRTWTPSPLPSPQRGEGRTKFFSLSPGRGEG